MATSYVGHQGNLRFIFAYLLFIFFVLVPAIVFATTPNWQGPYIGAYLGGGFANNHTSTDVGTVTNTSYFSTSTDISVVNNAGTITNSPNSVLAGIQAGHDWAWQSLVYGITFDYSRFSLDSSKSVNNALYAGSSDAYSIYTSMSTNWLFTLRGRLGYQTMLYWPGLLYITGGMALTQLTVSNNFSDNSSYSGAGGNSTSQNEIGWTAGAGMELASFNHMSLDLEYLYVKFPAVKTTSFISNTDGGFGIPAQSLTSPFSTTGQFHASLIKIGLNYRFDE